MTVFGSVSQGSVPSLAGATSWLNSEPLTPEGLRGRVVAFDFCTYTCINWLRTVPYIRAWQAKYAGRGFTVVGVHTPEFPFERELPFIREELARRGIEYPVAVDSDYGVWQAFDNHYWPALYLADADGQIRFSHFGEGRYDDIERAIQQLLGVDEDLVAVDPQGDEVSALWEDVRSPETYLGYERAESLASPGGGRLNETRTYGLPEQLRLNQWALAGQWTMRPGRVDLDEAGGRIAFRFHARDVNLIVGSLEPDAPVGFRVTVDGAEPGSSHGIECDERGTGTVGIPRMYQLIRVADDVKERTFEIEFEEGGIAAYCFTFG